MSVCSEGLRELGFPLLPSFPNCGVFLFSLFLFLFVSDAISFFFKLFILCAIFFFGYQLPK